MACLVACGADHDGGAAVAISTSVPANLGWLEFVVIAHSAEVILGVPVADPIYYARRADVELASFDHAMQEQTRSLVDLVELFAVLNGSEGRPFSQMSAAGKRAWLNRLRTSRDPSWRAAYHITRQLIVTAYYSDPGNWADIDYPGPPAVGEVLDDSRAGVLP